MYLLDLGVFRYLYWRKKNQEDIHFLKRIQYLMLLLYEFKTFYSDLRSLKGKLRVFKTCRNPVFILAEQTSICNSNLIKDKNNNKQPSAKLYSSLV